MEVDCCGKRRLLRLLFFGCALWGVLWLSYRTAFDAPFYFDTQFHLVEKSNLHVTSLTWDSLVDAVCSDHGGSVERPLSRLTLGLTYYFAGLAPRAYRIGNLAIHWAASLSLFFLLKDILGTPRVREYSPRASGWAVPLSAVAVCLWSLHPIQTNVATYVIQRMEGLCGLFSFLCAGCYVRARLAEREWSWGWGLACLLSLFLAVASKENGLVLVPLLFLVERLLFDPPRNPETARLLKGLGWLVLAAALLGVAWKGPAFWARFAVEYSKYGFTPWERLLTEIRLQPRYLWVLLVPDPGLLTLDANITLSRGLLEPPGTLLCLGAFGGALALALAVRRRMPLLSLGILWFFVSQLMEATLIPLELYYEHRMYSASVFLYLGIAWVALSLVNSKNPVVRWGTAVGLAVLLVIEPVATHGRNRLWADPVAFWSAAIRQDTAYARPRTQLASAYLAAKRYAEAERAALDALSLGGRKSVNYMTLGFAAYRQGRREAAREYFEKVELLDKWTSWRGSRSLAMLDIQEGKLDEADAHLKAVLARNAGDAETWNFVGIAELKRGNLASAEQAAEKAVQLDPGYAKGWNTLGAVRLRLGKRGLAAGAFWRAVTLDPTNGSYRSNLEQARRSKAPN